MINPTRLSAFLTLTLALCTSAAPVALFDGKSFEGWEGDTNTVWRIVDGTITGGSLEGNPRNEFLATRQSYRNFRLRLDYKLVGTQGFVNGGVQIRSRRIPNPPNEMSGYQADIGAGYSGFLYDESRRSRMLARADTNLVRQVEKPGDWNTYEIEAAGRQVTLRVNGRRTCVWVETDPAIEAEGLIALQIHGNCKAEISFRNISIETVPETRLPSEGEILGRFGQGQPALPRPPFDGTFRLEPGEVVVFVGQENLVREQRAGHLESMLATGFASQTPRFRSMAWEADTVYEQWRELNFGSWLRQLETAEAGVVVAQFGQMEAFDGPGRLTEFKAAYHRLLDQFAERTARLVLISPMPFEQPSAPHAPDLRERNSIVRAYAEAVREVAAERNAIFVDLFTLLGNRGNSDTRLTEDGIHLTEQGLEEVGGIVARQLGVTLSASLDLAPLRAAIVEKNRSWFDCWRPANWSFVYGDRVSQLYGSASDGRPSLQQSFELRRPRIAAMDTRIQSMARGERPPPLPPPGIPESSPGPEALSPEAQLATFTLAGGYQVNLFASETDGVVNPVQFSWDEKGVLYVACSPMYPQSMASEEPADYIIALQDTTGDGRADQSWRFAEGLTMVQGLEPGADGLYVCDFDQLLHLSDSNGDGRADSRRVLFSGFGIGDTHQLINSITHGPDGSLWFTQGLHAMSLVETPWGIARLDRSGVWRLRPGTLRLEGFFGGGMAGANCWGVAFDDYGQVFHKSGDRPHGYWSVPGLVRRTTAAGAGSRITADQSYSSRPEQYHPVGPLFETSPKTTALDIIGTRALPADIQGTALLGGYFGSVVELHQFHDAGSGFKTTQLPKLMKSSDNSFRPVDVSVGPDSGIYLADWYNPVIGHYQTSYTDSRRDKTHGRIWRVSARNLPPVRQPNLAAMSSEELLEQLRSPERWTRYQAKRLLFYRPTDEVLKAADGWVGRLDPADPDCERLLLEVAGVFEAHETVRPTLLTKLLEAKDFRVRAYGTRMIGAWAGNLPAPLKLLRERVRDSHPRVRLEAVVAASYIPSPEAALIATEALAAPMDPFLDYALRQTAAALLPFWTGPLQEDRLNFNHPAQADYLRKLQGTPPKVASPGEDLYTQACLPCHQPEGEGLAGVYPSLVQSDWVSGDPDRLIKIVLHGLTGPISVRGQRFASNAPIQMPSFAGLSDEQIADVLTFVRSRFGNTGSPITPSHVDTVRSSTAGRATPWTEPEL